jgi:hypothetical protein
MQQEINDEIYDVNFGYRIEVKTKLDGLLLKLLR